MTGSHVQFTSAFPRPLAALFVLAALAWPAPADACSCARSGCSGLASADAVFLATVSEIERATGLPPRTAQPPVRNAPNYVEVRGDALRLTHEVTLADVEPVRGASGNQVLTAMPGGSCGYSFDAGQRYLIVAQRDEHGRLWVSMCGLTTPAAKAGPMVEYARTLAETSSSSNFLWGTVTTVDPDRPSTWMAKRPAPDITVEVTGRLRRSVRTDASGQFGFRDLPPGDYTLAVKWPAPLTPFDQPAAFRFRIGPDARHACVGIDLTGG